MYITEKSDYTRKSITESGDFDFIRVNFHELSTDYGGAISCSGISGANIYVYLCKFLNCTASQQGGAIYFYDSNILQIERNKVEECTAGGWGGGIYMNSFKTPTVENKECISGCTFTKCKTTTQNGGGIEILIPPISFKIQNTILVDCYAGNCGGAYCFYANGGYITNSTVFYYLFHKNNSCGSQRGNDVHIWDIQTPQRCSSSPFVFCFSQTKNESKRVCRNKGEDEYHSWILTGTPDCYVKTVDGADNPSCGDSESNPCLTLKFCVGNIRNTGKWWINVLDNVEESNTVSISYNLFVKIMGKGEKISTIKSSYSPAFSVFGTLEISELTLNVNGKFAFSILPTGDVEIVNVIINSFYIFIKIKFIF